MAIHTSGSSQRTTLTQQKQKEGNNKMTFSKIALPLALLGSIAVGATSASAIGVYNPLNDSSPDAMTPGYTGLAKDLADPIRK
ncbi:MAG: hypothetical protein COA52_02890 [Hyphomicrobiales bacterium]|nr:MAG: hypothetical protein COA52_02890 [Hyphomicrobiales bacterium]